MTSEEKALIVRLQKFGLQSVFFKAVQEHRHRKCRKILKKLGYTQEEIANFLAIYQVKKVCWFCWLFCKDCRENKNWI